MNILKTGYNLSTKLKKDYSVLHFVAKVTFKVALGLKLIWIEHQKTYFPPIILAKNSKRSSNSKYSSGIWNVNEILGIGNLICAFKF